MQLPNADRAVVDPRKVQDYLLSETHPIGRFKAALFLSLGYSSAQWETLRDDLLGIARAGEAIPGLPSAYGRKYEVDGVLNGPSRRSIPFRTVWIVVDDNPPKFVTAFPR